MTKPMDNSAGPMNSTAIQLATTNPPPVEIESPDDLVPTDKEAEEALQSLGFTKLSGAALAAQRKVGLHLKGNGVLRSQRGIAFIAQQRLLQGMDFLAKFFDDGVPNAKGVKKPMKPREAVDVVKAIAISVGKMTDSQKFVVSMEQKEKPDGMPIDDVPVGKSFPPGTYIAAGAGASVHVHGPNPEPSTAVVEVPPEQKEVANPPPPS